MAIQIPEGYIAVKDERKGTCAGCCFDSPEFGVCHHPLGGSEAIGCMGSIGSRNSPARPTNIFKKIETVTDSKSDSEN